MAKTNNNFPKLHNAAWPGLVGKGDDSEPPISLDKMIELTANAEVDGVKFDGIDLFLSDPHISIDIDDDALKAVADNIAAHGLVVGTLVAPVWPPAGGGPANDPGEGRSKYLEQLRKACDIAERLRGLEIRSYGGIRIDTAVDVASWAQDPDGNQEKIAETFRQACDIAKEYDEFLVAEGEICWGGMHSCRRMVELLEMVNQPDVLGFQADMAHSMLFLMGYNAPEDAIVPESFDWNDTAAFDAAYKQLTDALRPWTLDFHVAQNDATVHGSGSHDKTGKHCQPNDPNGKLDIPKHAGFWLRDENGELTKKFKHICWDGCMFPNATLENPQTYNDILAAMIDVRDAHGWQG